MLQAVIFDVDGTLVDSVHLHARAWQEALAKFGVDIPYERVRSQIGKGGDQLMPALVPPQRLREIRDDLDKYRSELFKRKYLPYVKPFPKARELVQRLLEDSIQIALGSSAKGDELESYKKIAGIDDLIAHETTSDSVEKSKPHPDIFEAALGELHHPPPHACAVVGDSPYDAIAARPAHLRAIGLLCGGFPAQELWGAGYVALYRDPANLLEAYEREGERAFAGGLAQYDSASP